MLRSIPTAYRQRRQTSQTFSSLLTIYSVPTDIMKFTLTAGLGALALASFTNPTEARIGGWNGAAAQAAAMVISGFNGGTLNGPTSGGFRPGLRPIAPIHRPFDEDDDLGRGFATNHGCMYTDKHGRRRSRCWDEDDDLGWRPYHRDDDQGDEDDVGFHRAVQHRISKFRL